MKKFYKNFLKTSFCILIVFFAFGTHAADLNFSPSSGSYKVGDTINVRVVLSTPGESANAVSGSLSFSKDFLTLNSISKSNSLVSLWAVEPTYSNSAGTANMEGIILNGYTGSSGTVVTLSFRAKAVGSANVRFTSSSVLANDGQGSNILTGTGQANFSISKAEAAPVVKKDSSLTIQELKKKDETDLFARFLISSVGKKANSNYKVEIDGVEVRWDNQSGGIFETEALSKGTHTIKVSMDSVENEVITSSASFAINSILVPQFTEYSENIKEKEYIVIKGLADPSIDVVLNSKALLTSTNEILVQDTTVRSDDKGLFTYVSEKADAGVYEVSALARSKKGGESAKSAPIKINVSSKSISTGIMNTFSMLIPILALIVLLVISATWGWYKVLHYRENMRKKLLHTKSLISKSFNILDDDINEQIKIFKKLKGLQPLSTDEKAFINQFKKDIESAEQVIINEIKEDEK